MKKLGKSLIALLFVTALIYVFQPQINTALESPIAGNILLIVLIVVDGSVPFLSTY